MVMIFASMLVSAFVSFWRLGAGLEPIAVIPGLLYVTATGEAIEPRGGHLVITKDAGPFAESQVGGDDDACAFIQLVQKREEPRAT